MPRSKGSKLPLVSDKRPPSAFDAPNYGPSVKALGLGSRAAGRVTKFAKKLGATLDLDVALPPPGSKTISETTVEHLGGLCLCNSPLRGERDMLEELLFRHEQRRSQHIEKRVDGPRRRSLALLLHALEPTESPRLFLLQRFIDWQKGTGDYEPPSALLEESYGWALLGLRWFFRHSLESVWAGFGHLIDRGHVPSTDLTETVAVVLDAADGSSRWLPHHSSTLGEVTRGFAEEAGIQGEGHEVIGLTLDTDPGAGIVAAAVSLAALAMRIDRIVDPERRYRNFASLGQSLRVSMSVFSAHPEPDTTLHEWVGHLLARYAVGQHFVTATRKWQGGIDGFFFHPTPNGYELAPGVFPWTPHGGPTKIMAALWLMQGIGLVAQRDEGWMRTPAGERTINRVIQAGGGASE
ncbi:hypothetical protein G6O69_36940 [Pseudenhygromyxa sp. WMMC2535]|uniref:hypothetical protein n=1 Tax=Pseudenhygromyxa sp. WMMC2535 TaxID=2712867 RepID=UPI001553B492|nr:hypothetical protein [Pseudenhygromyxa sp. WMMC2535]NVB37263.1 hypothetical protein [Pseudenhygromyxa sp. WMMC2535]NVB43468.1 hypothetical protein [Pseudenhygromyxa sp. WMMC2535]